MLIVLDSVLSNFVLDWKFSKSSFVQTKSKIFLKGKFFFHNFSINFVLDMTF